MKNVASQEETKKTVNRFLNKERLLDLGLIVLALFAVRLTGVGYELLYISVCLLVILLNSSLINITSLVAILLIGKLIEVSAFNFIPDNNYAIHGFYFFLDAIIALSITLRSALCRFIFIKFYDLDSDNKIRPTTADLVVAMLFWLYTILNLIMLIEHSLRHLDHFGLEFNQYLYDNARFFWEHHAKIKITLNIAEFVVILNTVKVYFKSKNILTV